MQNNIFLNSLVCFFIILSNVFAVPPLTPGLEIISSSETEVTLSFTPQNWQSRAQKIDGNMYTAFDFRGAELTGAPGEPEIPTIPVILGIPLQGNVNVNVIQSNFFEENARIRPIPHVVKVEQMVRYDYRPDQEIYSHADYLPREVARLEPPDFYRDQRVVRLHLQPLQYLPLLNKVRKYSRIVVQIQFTGAERMVTRPRSNLPDEFLYRDLILNYDQAKNWRQTYDYTLARQTTGYDGTVLYKINVNKEGIYRITGKMLSEKGINLAEINPKHLKIYNNGGKELPRSLAEVRPEGPVENAILVSDGGDGKFDTNDYLLFYGRPLEGWDYNVTDQRFYHYINHYAFDNVYFLTPGTYAGKRMANVISSTTTGLTPETYYIDNFFQEEELFNPLSSGMNWVGRIFDSSRLEQIYQVNLTHIVPDKEATFKFRFGTFGPAFHQFSVSINNHYIGSANSSGSEDNLTLRDLYQSIPNLLQDGKNDIKINYNPSSNVVRAYTDWFEISYARKFVADGDKLAFNAPLKDGMLLYQISGFSTSDVMVFDVSNFSAVTQVTNTRIANGVLSFADAASSVGLKRYLAVAGTALSNVADLEKIDIPDIRSRQNADFIIITHDDFWDQALQLESLHEDLRMTDRMRTEVINVKDIFTEFSCGLTDPIAIRDFLKYVFENWTYEGSPTLKYVLLFGDGDYDFKNYLAISDKNWLPPYETTESSHINNRTTDDWFCYLTGSERYLDIAIGRLPVQSPEEAANVVEKIIQYETQPDLGDWRSIVTLVADDQNGESIVGTENMHTTQTETLANFYVPADFEQTKIYLVNYQGEPSAQYSRPVKPEANKDLLESINAGTLLLNYIGHGNPRLLAHERVLNEPADFDKIQNAGRLPLVVAATCDFGLWDDPIEQSFSENLVNVKDRGAIGIVASTRLAYSHDNAAFNNKFYEMLFSDFDSLRMTKTLGDAMKLTKNSRSGSVNDQKYNLLGLPTMRLAAPKYRLEIDSVEPDTIMALRKLAVKGKILKNGRVWSDYQGKVLLRVRDSEKDREYQYEVEGNTYQINYKMPGNTVFRGFSSIKNGWFEGKLIVPKDITYGGTRGRISVYAWNDDNSDAMGYTGNLRVGGTAKGLVDNKGPEIKIGFKDQEFFDGGYVGPVPVLRVEISDTVSGVNVAGAIGHQIEMILDNNVNNKHDLTQYFRYDEDSYYTGELLYTIQGLAGGEHVASIKAWDNANNASAAEVRFIVITDDEYSIENLLNYPNPMTNQTQFTFELLGTEAEINLKIYTVAGRLIRSFDNYYTNTVGFNIFPESWNGTDQDGDKLANGIYLYRLTARTNINDKTRTADAIGKLVIAR